jgi:putative lipoprotein (rSAM/lipoprotein system)
MFRGLFHHFLKTSSAAIGAAVGFLLGCDCLPFPIAEYGTPHADFKVSGTVTSRQTSQPVPGILVSIYDTANTVQASDSAMTDSVGHFLLKFTDHPSAIWILRVRDIDGDTNGKYTGKDSTISIPEGELTGGDGKWYEGSAENEINFELDSESGAIQ